MNRHIIYAPSQFIAGIRAACLDLAGGVTEAPGHRGFWRAPDGTVHEDDITLVTVIEQGTEALDAVVRLLLDGGEQAVALERNGVPELVE